MSKNEKKMHSLQGFHLSYYDVQLEKYIYY